MFPKDALHTKTVCGGGYSCSASVIRHSDMLCACRVTFSRGEEKLTYLMCDLASAANRNTDDPKFYTLFV